jgi:hypothetical protein
MIKVRDNRQMLRYNCGIKTTCNYKENQSADMLFGNTVHFIDYLFSIYSMYCIIFSIKIILCLFTVKDIYSLTALMWK